MRKILNYFTGVIITFLFLIFNDLDAIPSKYRLGIAAVILIFDAIVLAYELINSMKKNKSAKVLLQENICMISTFMILLILRISHLSQKCKFVIAGVVVCYIIISIIYNHKKRWKLNNPPFLKRKKRAVMISLQLSLILIVTLSNHGIYNFFKTCNICTFD